MAVTVEFNQLVDEVYTYSITLDDGDKIVVNNEELQEIVHSGSILLTQRDRILDFVKAWNDIDVMVSSLDIHGMNRVVKHRNPIDLDDLDCHAVELDECGECMTARKLIELYLADELRVYKEVEYI